jgi:hypothetical protein
MYRAELEQQEVSDVDKMMAKQFPAWFENHVSATRLILTVHAYTFKLPNSECFQLTDYHIEI